MIRLTLLLCAALYFGLMVLGEDHGQKRYGLLMADKLATTKVAAPATQPQATAVTEAVFVPAQPVMTAPVVAQPTEPLAPTLASTAPAESLTTPDVPGGALYSVTANVLNVRGGPGTDFDVVGSLTHGEEILVVTEDNAVDGWSRIRIEGDGFEGYVATRLLQAVN